MLLIKTSNLIDVHFPESSLSELSLTTECIFLVFFPLFIHWYMCAYFTETPTVLQLTFFHLTIHLGHLSILASRDIFRD